MLIEYVKEQENTTVFITVLSSWGTQQFRKRVPPNNIQQAFDDLLLQVKSTGPANLDDYGTPGG